MDYKTSDKERQFNNLKRTPRSKSKSDDLLTPEEKESLAITLGVFVSLFVCLIFFKFSEKISLTDLEGGGGGGGVTVNFGDSDVGSGNNYQSEVLNVTNKQKQQAAPAAAEEEIVASNLDDAPAVVRTVKPTKKDPNPKQQETKPVVVKEQPRQIRNSALDNIINSNSRGGDGDGGGSGNQGRLDGDRNSNGYYGSGGSGGGTGGGTGSGNGTGTGPGSGSGSGGGSGGGRGTGVGNYQLAGRKALVKPEPAGCNETGKVVVDITVDSSGRVIKTGTGRGTNASPCLISQAKSAAERTKFDAGNAEQQVGKIIYNFTLTE